MNRFPIEFQQYPILLIPIIISLKLYLKSLLKQCYWTAIFTIYREKFSTIYPYPFNLYTIENYILNFTYRIDKNWTFHLKMFFFHTFDSEQWKMENFFSYLFIVSNKSNLLIYQTLPHVIIWVSHFDWYRMTNFSSKLYRIIAQ